MKVSMTWNGKPFSAEQMTADLKREMLASVEKDLIARTRRAAPRPGKGKGSSTSRSSARRAASPRASSFTGDEAALDAAKGAVAGK